MALDKQALALAWMQQRLELLDDTIVKLRQLRLVAQTDEDKRSVDGRVAEMNMAFAHAKAQYDVAKLGASQLQPPDKATTDRIVALADRVSHFVATGAAINAGIRLAGEVFDLMKQLAA